MGEQFIDLFTAGAYALAGRIYTAVGNPALSWLFYLLATAGVVFAILEGALEQRPDLWLRHLAAVCLAAVLTLMPRTIDLTTLTYGAPGVVEKLFNTHVGAAPHLTYWIERLGANAATGLRALTHQQAFLAVPGVAAQVADVASDPASVSDAQLKANLEIWRRRIVPQLLDGNSDLAQQVQASGLGSALLNPIPIAPQFVGTAAAERARSVEELLANGQVNLVSVIASQSTLINQITHDAGATAWVFGSDVNEPIAVTFAQSYAPATARRIAMSDAAYDDALQRADGLLLNLRTQLPSGGNPVPIRSANQLYDLLGRSVLYAAGSRLALDPAARAALGSLCQRAGADACSSAMAPLIEAAGKLRVAQSDRYNRLSWTTWLQQPIATTLLTITSLMLSTISTLVVSVLPFALGVAKSMAILISIVGTWMLLWPGRARIALTWMVGPISFVSLWSVLFNLWSDIEPGLAQIAAAVSDSNEGSFSARRLMSIAIALGYMGLPSLALGIVYGESGRALYHASARLETALLMAWHTRGTIAAFGRRWIVNSPMVRRWNQRAYRAIGMGPLRPTGARSTGVSKSSTRRGSSAALAAMRQTRSTKMDSSTADLFSPGTAGAPLASDPRPASTRRTPRNQTKPMNAKPTPKKGEGDENQ
jgi:hypothetical protein